MQKNDADFLGLALSVINIGAELYLEASKGEEHFYNYCLENKDVILSKISGNNQNINYESIFKSSFVKNNFSELSDYVVRYYDEAKRAK